MCDVTHMHIHGLWLTDFRAFKTVALEFMYPGSSIATGQRTIRHQNVNVILGENGSGKSSVLDAIALAVLSPLITSSGYRPYALVRRSARGNRSKASIEVDAILHTQDVMGGVAGNRHETFRALIEKRGDIEFVEDGEPNKPRLERLYNERTPAFFLVGYGATRRVEAVSASDLATRRRSRILRYERVASLFEEHFALLPLNAWLPEWRELNPGRHKQVITLINKLTPSAIRFEGSMEGGEYLFRHRGVVVPFGALSDGYKAYLGWISDLLYHLTMGAPSGAKLVDTKGVVLVDEIDLHIHPAWQRTIIPTIAETLPNLQFVFTTHSPLVVGTLQRENLMTVIRDKLGFPKVERPDEETLGLSADQILRSEAFGLDSTRDPQFRSELIEIQKQAVAGEPGAALKFMQKAAVGDADIEAVEAPPVPDWLQKLAKKS